MEYHAAPSDVLKHTKQYQKVYVKKSGRPFEHYEHAARQFLETRGHILLFRYVGPGDVEGAASELFEGVIICLA